jgi:Kef-type K+ transport systems, membrane components
MQHMSDTTIPAELAPTILFLFFGVVAVLVSRAIRVSSIVSYIMLGLVLRLSGLSSLFSPGTIAMLAELGLIFLLFEIGLNFPLKNIREQAANIFAFGPIQVLFGTATIGSAGIVLGLPVLPALLVGAILALTSTAIVARLIVERRQQNCPVGVTSTSILIFQDLTAIFLLIVANSLNDGGPVLVATAKAVIKAILAFTMAMLVAKLVLRPLLRVVANSRNEEVFTALALLIALAAGWATAYAGLSLTLGAFLGGMALAETPYRAVIEFEIKPFRGLLLGFFFISIGLSLDIATLSHQLPVVLLLTLTYLVIKIFSNTMASRVFHWSVPGSTQLGFLLAGGSEFAFVIMNLPSMRRVIGLSTTSIVTAMVTLSMAVSPHLANAGRLLAGRMRERLRQKTNAELDPLNITAPVIIVGMSSVGRTVADALIKFRVGYHAVECDQKRLQEAIADGYSVSFGDGSDVRLWGALNLCDRKISVLTAPRYDNVRQTATIARTNYPGLKRFVLAANEAEASRFSELGLLPVIDHGKPRGLDLATAVLAALECPVSAIEAWASARTRSENEDVAAVEVFP